MTTFSVLIVGGGVAGLVLANILEKYNIEYTLLEKHNAIVSDLGASVAILPHGSRVLDQIGCYHNLRSRGGPVKNMGIFGPDGKPINSKKLPEDCLKTMLVSQHDRRLLLMRLSQARLSDVVPGPAAAHRRPFR